MTTIATSAIAHEPHTHPIDTSVWGVFAKQVYQTPNVPALIELTSNGASAAITYQDVFQEAQTIAALLQDAGVRPGEIVAFRLNRGRAALTAILGIVASGAAYLPLDPEWPQAYQDMQLLDAHVRLLLVEAPPHASHPFHIEQVVHASIPRAENDAEKVQAEVASSSSAPYGGEQLLYVLYTSGTTGKPKGVRIPHRAVLARFLHPDYLSIRPGQRIAHCASLTFDASTFEIWGTLLNGGCLVSFPKELMLAGQAFLDALKQHHISILFLTTALFHRYARQFPDGFADLEAVLFGGEATDTSAVEALLASHPPQRLLHMYGPTENTVFSAWYEVDTLHPLAEHEKPLPIGQALPASSCYVLDEQQREVSPGEEGELYVGGDGLALGYLNRPDITRERFLDNARFGRLYRTGDVVRALPDGNLIFVGRRDGQVKLRGLRIELDAVENILRGHPVIQEVACSVEGSGEQAMLVAFLVFHPTAKREEQSDSELLASFRALFATHPSYLIPGRFYRVPDLPLTTNGKRDRALLTQSLWRENVQPSLLTGASSFLPESKIALASQVSPTSLHPALRELCVATMPFPFDEITSEIRLDTIGWQSLHLATFASHIAHRLNWPGDQVLRLLLSAKEPTIASYAQVLTHYAHEQGVSLAPLLTTGQCEAQPQRQSPTVRKQETLPSYVTIRRSPLLPLVLARQLAPIDAAAFSYLPILAHDGQRQTMREAFGPRPTLTHIVSTQFGRIGLFLLPIEAHLLYEHREHLLNLACEATYLAQSAGATTVALTGLIPSALGYGHDLVKRLHDDREQAVAIYQGQSQHAPQSPPCPPTITTGHAVTASAVVMNVTRLLDEAGRHLGQERVAFLGLGSIGQASLCLLLEVLPHPKELILCDLYQRNLSTLEQELRQIGYQGRLHMALGEPGHVSAQVYDASLIIGATNVGDILDVDRLAPGTLLIDDSGPHIFDVARLLQRIHVHGDILATEAGEFTVPQSMHEIRYIPAVPSRTTIQTKAHPSMEGISLSDLSALDNSDIQSWVERLLHTEEAIGLRDTTAREAMGCLLAGALTQALHTPPTLGLVTADIAKAHYTALVQAGCRGASPHLTNEYRYSTASLKEFRSRFGNIHRDDNASSEKRSA